MLWKGGRKRSKCDIKLIRESLNDEVVKNVVLIIKFTSKKVATKLQTKLEEFQPELNFAKTR